MTVADELAAGRLDAASHVLADFAVDVTFDRVHVLAEQPGRIWRPVADALLGERPAAVGRGACPSTSSPPAGPTSRRPPCCRSRRAPPGRPSR